MKHSKRITLGTYTERGVYNSFSERQFVDGGLAEAINAAEKSAGESSWRPERGELGVCVAVFSIDLVRPSRIVARFPFRAVPSPAVCPTCGQHIPGEHP